MVARKRRVRTSVSIDDRVAVLDAELKKLQRLYDACREELHEVNRRNTKQTQLLSEYERENCSLRIGLGIDPPKTTVVDVPCGSNMFVNDRGEVMAEMVIQFKKLSQGDVHSCTFEVSDGNRVIQREMHDNDVVSFRGCFTINTA